MPKTLLRQSVTIWSMIDQIWAFFSIRLTPCVNISVEFQSSRSGHWGEHGDDHFESNKNIQLWSDASVLIRNFRVSCSSFDQKFNCLWAKYKIRLCFKNIGKLFIKLSIQMMYWEIMLYSKNVKSVACWLPTFKSWASIMTILQCCT